MLSGRVREDSEVDILTIGDGFGVSGSTFSSLELLMVIFSSLESSPSVFSSPRAFANDYISSLALIDRGCLRRLKLWVIALR